MNEPQQKLKTAQDIFQTLTTVEQLEIKQQQPDLYHALFGGDINPNTYYLEPFIEKYQTDENNGNYTESEQKSSKVNLSAEIVQGFKNAKFSKVPADIVDANNIFQKLSVETQTMIKKDKPEIYNMLFKENVFVDTSALSAFTKDYSPSNLDVKTFADFDRLTLSAQVNFKNNFPGEYREIMKSN